MSRHHAAHSGDVNHIINDIEHMKQTEAEEIYGISFEEDGKIFDTMYNRTFSSLREWAELTYAEDELEYEEDINHHKEGYSGLT